MPLPAPPDELGRRVRRHQSSVRFVQPPEQVDPLQQVLRDRSGVELKAFQQYRGIAADLRIPGAYQPQTVLRRHLVQLIGIGNAGLECLPGDHRFNCCIGITTCSLGLDQSLTNTVQELELFLDDLCRSRERLLVLSFGAGEDGAKDALVHGQHFVGQGGACLKEQCHNERMALFFVETAKVLGRRLYCDPGELEQAILVYGLRQALGKADASHHLELGDESNDVFGVRCPRRLSDPCKSAEVS